MQLVNFEFTKDNIGIQFAGEYFDLHNCADFQAISYSIKDRCAEMVWSKNTEWASDSFPNEIKIIFEELENILITGRDPEMPFTEDGCVSHIGFQPNANFNDKGASDYVDHNPSADTHLACNFHSGACFRLLAKKAILVIRR